jgi:putative transposase
MYYYRKMTPKQREEIVAYRRQQHRPWHSPPHWEFQGQRQFLLTASCFNHAHIIGYTPERMTKAESDLLETCQQLAVTVYAWCILPNHYHILLRTDQLPALRTELGKFHGRSSFAWNGEEQQRGRQVWHNCFDHEITSNRHFWATMNYVHHNPVKHRYTTQWQDWPWSSAADFLESIGRDKALQLWQEFPILDYGKDWDNDPED